LAETQASGFLELLFTNALAKLATRLQLTPTPHTLGAIAASKRKWAAKS